MHLSFVDEVIALEHYLFHDLIQRRWTFCRGAREQLHHVRHLVQDFPHLIHTRADAAQKVLRFLVEFVGVIAQEKLAESVDGEDRGLQIV